VLMRFTQEKFILNCFLPILNFRISAQHLNEAFFALTFKSVAIILSLV
jgi:hypothetical protein